jgi:hypothetical protein
MKSLMALLAVMFFSLSALAQTKVAVVKVLRGEVDVLTIGKTTRLKVNEWVEQGSVIKTAERSFVKLVFTDKSQMNLGPNSEMKIESFSGKDSGVIDLVKGKIRSQVTKDYLQMQDRDKSKLFIKTKTAVLGVRGTDFMVSTNENTTSTILFEGEIVFNKLSERDQSSPSSLEDTVNRGVRMFPGEFSVQEAARPMPTVPAILNIQQREMLEKNADFESTRTPSNSSDQARSVVPEGLSGAVVANNSSSIGKEVINSPAEAPKPVPAARDPEGYVKGDLLKPANGSIIHVDSGVIIPPGPSSVLDANTNTFIPGPEVGKITGDGNYIPPKNVEITSDGKIMVALPGEKGQVVVQQVERPVPVYSQATVSIGQVRDVLQRNPDLLKPGRMISNDIINHKFNPNGLNDLSNNRLNHGAGTTPSEAAASRNKVDTTIIVNPQ